MAGAARLLQFPPHGAYLPEVRNFDQVGSATPGAGAEAQLVSYKIPTRCRAVLRFVGQSVLDSDAWASLTWRVTVDGSSVEGLLWTTRVGLISDPAEVYLALGPRQTVAVQARNGGGAGFAACARIKGYFWPEDNALLGPPEGGPK